jgi:hypothetical protein
MVDGAIATLQGTVTATAPVGSLTIPLTGMVGVNTTGTGLAIVSGTPYSINVTKAISKCDINGDGSVNVLDVTEMINGALGKSVCPYAGPGACSLVNVFAVVYNTVGGACILQ